MVMLALVASAHSSAWSGGEEDAGSPATTIGVRFCWAMGPRDEREDDI
jgi:hypothetical protein